MLSYHPNQPKPPAPRARCLVLLLALLVTAQSIAGPMGALQLYGGLGYGHDDNLLRIPDGLPAFDNQYADSWLQAEAGLLFDQTYSRQRLSGHAKFSKVKFDHFSQLDYTGKDAQAKWNWQVGNHLEGALGATYSQTLAPYTDFHIDQRNLREQRRTFFDGAWRFHPSYRARTAVSRDKTTYELALQRFNDRTEDAWELGADYLPASGSEFGLVVRHLKGKYPNRRPLAQQLIDNDYDQDEFKARVVWKASGSTTVQALAGWAKRRQPALGDDTSGFNGRVSANYKPAGKLSYTAALWRDFAPIESIYVSYTLNKGISVGAAYEASAKVKLEANASYEQRKYNPRLAAVAGRDLDDSLRTASLRATWSPRRTIQLSAALAHQARSGSVFLGIGEFTSNSIVLNANAQF